MVKARRDGRTAAPMNQAFEESELLMFRFQDGRIVESWATWDRLSFLEQLGAIDKGADAFERSAFVSDMDRLFSGSMPELYDRFRVPLMFAPFARHLARCLDGMASGDVLETRRQT